MKIHYLVFDFHGNYSGTIADARCDGSVALSRKLSLTKGGMWRELLGKTLASF